MGRLLSWLPLILLLPAGAPAQQPKVALHPMVLPGPLQTAPGVSALFDSLLIAELGQQGYGVVPSAESGRIWQQLVDSVQGFYDPITGDTVRAEFDAVRTGTLRRLAAGFGAAFLLRTSVEMVSVQWDRGKAKWDGVSEGVSPTGGWGSVAALTLVVVAEDSTGRVVATGRGGIRVVAKVRGQGGYESLSEQELFGDYDRNLKAVALALKPFLKRGGPSQ